MRKFVLFLSLLPLTAIAQTPCASPLVPKVTPCGQQTSDDVLATLDEQPIRIADLDAETRKSIEGLDAAIATARAKASREVLDDILLEREAARRGITTGRLIYSEIMMKTPRPAEADVAAEIASHPTKYKHGAEDSERAAGNLYDKRLEAREKEFISALETRFHIQHAPGQHADVAAADARISALADQRDAVNRIIHDRLLAAEAKKRGVAPEEVTRVEVAEKLVQPTDAEVKSEWEKWKGFYGDDFEKARPDVVRSMQRERTTELEKKFDARLREGHAIRMLFEVPRRPALEVVARHSPSRGLDNAPVTLVEWADFQCPACGAMSSIVEEALQPYGDRVRYVYRQCPLSMHPHAWKASEAALAAHAQGKFFPYARILFANQNSLDVASLKKYARQAGLDAKRFDADLDSGRFAGDVAADKRAGIRAGLLGTPTFFINGVRAGYDVYSLEGMRAAIDDAAASRKP